MVFVSELLRVEKENIEEAIINLKAKKDIVEETRDERVWVFDGYLCVVFSLSLEFIPTSDAKTLMTPSIVEHIKAK